MKKTAIEWLRQELEYLREYEEFYTKRYMEVDALFREAKEIEKQQDEYNINTQIEIIQDVLNELMTGFESPEDRWDFILDIVNGYKDRILTNK